MTFIFFVNDGSYRFIWLLQNDLQNRFVVFFQRRVKRPTDKRLGSFTSSNIMWYCGGYVKSSFHVFNRPHWPCHWSGAIARITCVFCDERRLNHGNKL